MIKTIEMHMYLVVGEHGTYSTVDSMDWRTMPSCMKGRTWLGSQTVDFNFPDIDEHQAAIDALNATIQQERVESQAKINLLLERISKLQAIGHEVAK